MKQIKSLLLLAITIFVGISKADNIQEKTLIWQEAVKSCVQEVISINHDNIEIKTIGLFGMNSVANYNLRVGEDEYFTKVTRFFKKPKYYKDYIEAFNELKTIEINSVLGEKLRDLSVALVYPVHSEACFAERYSESYRNKEVLFFPFLNGITLDDIQFKIKPIEALSIGQIAFYKYGEALAIIATTRIEIETKQCTLNVPDRHLENAMYDIQNNRLHLIDTVSPGSSYCSDKRIEDIFKESLRDIYWSLILGKKSSEKLTYEYGILILNAFAQGFYSILSASEESYSQEKLENSLSSYLAEAIEMKRLLSD